MPSRAGLSSNSRGAESVPRQPVGSLTSSANADGTDLMASTPEECLPGQLIVTSTGAASCES